jgi:hypothetical protein
VLSPYVVVRAGYKRDGEGLSHGFRQAGDNSFIFYIETEASVIPKGGGFFPSFYWISLGFPLSWLPESGDRVDGEKSTVFTNPRV